MKEKNQERMRVWGGQRGWQEGCTEKVILSQSSKEVRRLLVQLSKGRTLQAEATGTNYRGPELRTY